MPASLPVHLCLRAVLQEVNVMLVTKRLAASCYPIMHLAGTASMKGSVLR